jgi:2-polyprenyl-3-methyl-5-hydroxy-6-metoxy-1,4-benzoquinol methylase
MSAYYAEEYHQDFNFKQYKKVSRLADYFSKPRNYSRYQFLKKTTKQVDFKNVLEIGGGNGDFYSVMNAKGGLRSYTIVEPNPSYNLVANNLQYHNMLFEEVPEDQLVGVDLIVMFHVLEHIFDVDAFFARVKQLGVKYLFFEVPNIADTHVKEDSLLKHPHYHHYSEGSLMMLLKKNGFTKYFIESIRPITYHPYEHIPKASRILNKIIGRNEVTDPKGLYLRTLIDLT